MNVTRHPETAWIIDYANGRLGRSFELVLGAHLMACPECTATLRAAETLGANLMCQGPGADVDLAPAGVFAAEPGSPRWLQSQPLPLAGADPLDLPAVVSRFLDCGIAALPWRHAGRGLQVARLRADAEERLWLIKAAPGTVLPRHSHVGSELTLVLKGAFFSRNTIYSAGDIEDADESVDHQPVVTRDGECLCLAVTEGPLRFHGLINRLAQGFIGI